MFTVQALAPSQSVEPFLGCLLELSAFHPEAVKTSSGCAKSTVTGEIYLNEGREVSL